MEISGNGVELGGTGLATGLIVWMKPVQEFLLLQLLRLMLTQEMKWENAVSETILKSDS